MRNPFSRKPKSAKRTGPGVTTQFRQAFSMISEIDPSLKWWMIGAFIIPIVVFTLVGVLLSQYIIWPIIGVLAGLAATIFIFNRRAKKAMFNRFEDQPGAAGQALSMNARMWAIEDEPVAIDARTRDMVFRAVGRPGIVLVAEGPLGRVKKLAEDQKKRLNRVAPNAPVTIIYTGDGEGQTPLKKLQSTMNRMRPAMSKEEVNEVKNRLRSLGNARQQVPKGVDPSKMAASSRRMRRF